MREFFGEFSPLGEGEDLEPDWESFGADLIQSHLRRERIWVTTGRVAVVIFDSSCW